MDADIEDGLKASWEDEALDSVLPVLEPGVILLVEDALFDDSTTLIIASDAPAIDPNVLVGTVGSADKVMLVLESDRLERVVMPSKFDSVDFVETGDVVVEVLDHELLENTPAVSASIIVLFLLEDDTVDVSVEIGISQELSKLDVEDIVVKEDIESVVGTVPILETTPADCVVVMLIPSSEELEPLWDSLASALDSVTVDTVVVVVSEIVKKVVTSPLIEVVVERGPTEEMIPPEYNAVEVVNFRPSEIAVFDSRLSDPVEVKVVVIAWLPTPSSDVEVGPSGEDVESRDIVSSVIIDESGSVIYTAPVVVETSGVAYVDTGVFTVVSVVHLECCCSFRTLQRMC